MLRAGDVIPQVVSPAPHVVENQAPPAAAAPAGALPVLRHARRSSRRTRVFTQVPQPRLPGPRVAAAQALRLARRDGHRRPRREAGGAAAGARAGAHGGRLLPADRASSCWSSRASASSRRSNLLAAIEASKQRPFARVLFALGIEEVGEVTGRNLAQRFRDIDAPAGRHAGGDRADAGHRREDGRLDPRAAGRRAHARADRGPARSSACASARRARRPSEGPLAGKTLVLTGTLPSLIARAGHRADPGGRRASDGLGVEEDRLPRRRREPRVQAREGRAAGRGGDSTKRGCMASWRAAGSRTDTSSRRTLQQSLRGVRS